MKRLHVMIQVKDLQESTRFYRNLFDAEPTVVETDYAKWMLEDPRVNFSIAVRPQSERLGVEHLGIQAESEEELEELRERIARVRGQSGVAIYDEGETVCCYHRSNKSWVTDSQGVSWEAFYTSGRATSSQPPPQVAEEATAASSDACCADSCCANSRSLEEREQPSPESDAVRASA